MTDVFCQSLDCTGQPRATLLCLHGWGFDHRCWLPLAEQLQADFDLLLVDLPGFGRSAPGADWCRDSHARVSALLDRQAKPVFLLGWSLGGQLALSLLQHPQVCAVIALATNLQFRAEPDWPCAMDPSTYRAFCENFARAPLPTLRRFYGLVAAGGDLTGRQLQAQFGVDPAHSAAWQQALLALSQWDLRALIFAKPVLMVLADQDNLVPVALAEVMRRQRALRVETVPGGHALPVAQPAQVASLIREFCHGA